MTTSAFREALGERLGDSTFGVDPPDAPPAAVSTSQSAIGNGTVVTVKTHVPSDMLHIRQAASTSANVVTSVPNGTQMQVTGDYVPIDKSPSYPDGGGFYPVQGFYPASKAFQGFAWAAYLVGQGIIPVPIVPVRPSPQPVPVKPQPTPKPTPSPKPVAAGFGANVLWAALSLFGIAAYAGYEMRKKKKPGSEVKL